jgi:putative DNA primase/helicase
MITTLETALAAYDAGVCPIRAKVNGDKRPISVTGWGAVKPDGSRGSGWMRFCEERPDRSTVERWFANGHAGIGVVTGTVSGNLEMVELEGHFMKLGLHRELKQKLRDAGVMDVWTRMVHGYAEQTPLGGMHVVYRIADGEVPGNTKLARDIDDNGEIRTLIETRGEGGFVVIAPSGGTTHPTGKPWKMLSGGWATLQTITMAERASVFEVLETFDTNPPAPTPPPPTSDKRTKVRPFTGTTITGKSWVDAVADHVDASESVREVLERHGWTHCYDCADGRQVLRRPSKDHGTSGWINTAGRFMNFSSSAPFEAYDKRKGRTRTYDALDIIAIYEHHGDRMVAARAIGEATGILAAWKRERDRIGLELLKLDTEPAVDTDTANTTTTNTDIVNTDIVNTTTVNTDIVNSTDDDAEDDDDDDGADLDVFDGSDQIEVVDTSRFFGTHGLLHASLRVAVMEHGPIAVGPGKSLWHYESGVWLPGGDDEVRRRCRHLLGQRWRKSHVEGVIADLASNRQFITDQQPTRWINCANGLLDWRTGELHPHRPEIPTTYQLTVNWNPDATCPTIDTWLAQVAPDDAVDLAWEVFGTAVYPDMPFHRAVLLLGPGRNGKGTYLRLVGAVIGARHISSVTIQQLAENRFMVAQLFGKVANISGDLDSRSITNTDTFKMATGGDMLEAEQKYGQPFRFVNRATLLFSANEAPGTHDHTDGFFSRWVVVPFTKLQLEPGAEDPGIETRMHHELEGALVRAVDGLRRAMNRPGFDTPASVIAATSDYRETSDPVRRFMDDVVTVTGSYSDTIGRTHVYKLYRRWCDDNGNKPLAASKFYRRMVAINQHVDLDRVYGGERRIGGITVDEMAVSAWL